MYQLWVLLITIMGLMLASSCSNTDSSNGYEEDQTMTIVTTTDIIADWASQITGNSVQVFSLVPSGSDPHTFSPSAQDIALIADADIIFSIGLGLEDEWLDSLIENTISESTRLSVLGNVIEPLTTTISKSAHHGEESEHDPHENEESEHDPHDLALALVEADPHFWLDPLMVDLAIAEMTTVLAEHYPAKSSTFTSNSKSYSTQIQDLHQHAKSQFSTIPAERRLIVANHNSLSYLANRYDFQVVGSISHSHSTHDKASPKELSELVQKLDQLRVPAIFNEFYTADRLPLRISEETGIPLVNLHVGALDPLSDDAMTYIDLMNFNIQAITGALK